MTSQETTNIIVLNDGETYTGARGCMLTTVPVSKVEADRVEEVLSTDEDEPLAFIHEAYGAVIIELTGLGRRKVQVI